jgi:3-oxoacyl-[acyl-carrier protein] reductase
MKNDDDIVALADGHRQHFEELDLLVLCAGVGSAGEIASYPIRKFDRQIAVNVRAPLLLTQQLLPTLRKTAADDPERGSKIIAISSLTGMVAEPLLAAYGASKAALISLCESILVEEAANGVTATAISPGFVNTEMSEWLEDRIDPTTMIRALDVALLVSAISRMSRYAAIPNVAITRPGTELWRA